MHIFQEAEKKRKVEKLKQKRWQEKHRRFIFGIHHSADENELGDREPLVPPSNSSNDGVFNARQPETGNMMSVSDDSEYYKEKRGSLSLLQILEGLPDDKSSRASRASSKSHIISESDEESDTDSAGSTGPVESYDLLKSRETSRDRIDSIPEEAVVAVPIPRVAADDEDELPPPPPEETEERHLVPHHDSDEETTHL
jgi:hypothetical protein